MKYRCLERVQITAGEHKDRIGTVFATSGDMAEVTVFAHQWPPERIWYHVRDLIPFQQQRAA